MATKPLVQPLQLIALRCNHLTGVFRGTPQQASPAADDAVRNLASSSLTPNLRAADVAPRRDRRLGCQHLAPRCARQVARE